MTGYEIAAIGLVAVLLDCAAVIVLARWNRRPPYNARAGV